MVERVEQEGEEEDGSMREDGGKGGAGRGEKMPDGFVLYKSENECAWEATWDVGRVEKWVEMT